MMMTDVNMDSYRKKSPYFTDTEKDVLLDLISHEKDIIQTKDNDKMTISKKEKCWARIKSNFNATPGVHAREHKQLKALWKNLKQRARRQIDAIIAADRSQAYRLEACSSHVDEISQKILSILPEVVGGSSGNNALDDDVDQDLESFEVVKVKVEEDSDDYESREANHLERPESTFHDPQSTPDVIPSSNSTIPTSTYSLPENNLSTDDIAFNPCRQVVTSATTEKHHNSTPQHQYSCPLKNTAATTKAHSDSAATSRIHYDKPKSSPVKTDKLDAVQARMLEMAELEHKKKMRILELEEDILILKKRKLEQDLFLNSAP